MLATVPHLWLAAHVTRKAGETGRLQLASTPRPALLGPVVEATPCFAEVHVTEQLPAPMAPCPPAGADHPGRIGIELPSGVRLSVDAAVDAEALSRVLGVLAR